MTLSETVDAMYGVIPTDLTSFRNDLNAIKQSWLMASDEIKPLWWNSLSANLNAWTELYSEEPWWDDVAALYMDNRP